MGRKKNDSQAEERKLMHVKINSELYSKMMVLSIIEDKQLSEIAEKAFQKYVDSHSSLFTEFLSKARV